MRTTIDEAGRIVVPKAMRQRLGLTGGQEVEISARDGRIEIEPATTPMRLVRRSGTVVSVPEQELPSLTSELVRDCLEEVRR